jgi:hypothetical protein
MRDSCSAASASPMRCTNRTSACILSEPSARDVYARW